MHLRYSMLAMLVAALSCGPAAVRGANDAASAAVTATILQRIGALNSQFPGIDWTQEVTKAKVLLDGSCSLALEHGVKWVLDRPGEPPSKLNGRRPVYEKGGFWCRLTFFRGPWKGAAIFKSVDFGDLHLWFESGYENDAAVIRVITTIIEEEQRPFENVPVPKPDFPAKGKPRSLLSQRKNRPTQPQGADALQFERHGLIIHFVESAPGKFA